MTRLVISAAGMVTAVGLDLPSSCASLRARLDGFCETRFLGGGGDWLIGAPVPLPRNWIGEKRMAHLLAGALTEIFDAVPAARAEAALILCLAEPTRAGRPIRDTDRFLRLVGEITDMPQAGRSRFVAHGRPSGIAALETAARLLAEGRAERVIVAGVDSYLTGLTIGDLMAADRLLTASNPDGFIPGEAAAAVLCTASGPGLRIAGIGLSREAAFFRNGLDEDGLDLPLRADGMTAAYRAAFTASGKKHSDIGIKIGDLIGESYWFRQTALAMLRTQRERSEVQPIWPIAASLGNVGAAVVPLMAGWAFEAARKGYAGGGPILLEASGDDGACGAVVAVAA